MGFFDWLFPSKIHVELADEIWMTHEAKQRGFVQRLQQHIKEHDRLIIVVHFVDSMEFVCELLRQAQIDFEHIQHAWDARDTANFLQQSENTIVILAESLPDTRAIGQSKQVDEFSPITSIFVYEKHLLLSQDERITLFAKSLPCRTELKYFLSLEDPLIKIFFGDWVQDWLTSAGGLQEDEAIESKMVGRRIRTAQKMIEEKIGNQPFAGPNPETTQQWLERAQVQ
ncbi:MAG: hypothetical protein COA78_18470 [Blastopirellula sp.]|nr:MAG: hypothetical protein COA78_18470 [Blastopirellula sp.]